MSTDKLQALSNTVAQILSKPPSPPTFFDEEPDDAAQASEQVAKASDNLRPGTEIPKENFGKLTSRKFGISPNEIHDADIIRDTANESLGIARQARADQISVAPQGHAGNQQLSKVSHETASPRSDPYTASINRFRTVESGNRNSLGRWRSRGFAVILLAAGIGAAAVIWLRLPGDAAKTAPSQPAALAQTAPTTAVSIESVPLLQSMARDLASVGKEIEQLKASQEQLTRGAAGLSERLMASQEQVARNNANVAEQIKTIQDQLARINAQASEHNAPPEIATAPLRPTLPRPRPTVTAARKPVPKLSSPLATAKPKAEDPKLSSASRPPAPARY
jgi:hypothetical protein